MATPQVLPTVYVTGKRRVPPSDDVTIIIDGRVLGGWMDVRITRGIERMPSDFEVSTTEHSPGAADVVAQPGDSCEVRIGKDLVLTGYVDRYMPGINAGQHEISISGRGKCADLVDCGALWPGSQINTSDVFSVAKILAKPYGIEVSVEPGQDVGPAIPQVNFGLGEAAFDVIEALCRFRALLAFETTTGGLHLGRVGTAQAASGFAQGVNVIQARALYSQDQRYSEYTAFLVSTDLFRDIGDSGNLLVPVLDEQVTRFRNKFVPAEGPPSMDVNALRTRAIWEKNRRFGRGYQVRITTDSWRDAAGALYAPNTLVVLDLPALKLQAERWLIGEVSYHRGSDGTTCQLLVMPPEAFSTQPPNWPQWVDILPGNASDRSRP